ncbi:MAG: prephenate dehydratase [Chloroflexota bacterium]
MPVNSTTDPTIIAFQGVHGANSEQAIRQQFGDSVETLPKVSFNDLFQAVESGEATYALLPVENSLAGTVANSYELLMDYDLRVQAEVIFRVRYALLAPAGTTLADVKQVRSHPQALAQCEHYLTRRGFKPVVWFDTAGSARDLAADLEPNTAAIAPPLAGKLYNLETLDSGIEDEAFNYTRFFVLGHGEPPPGERNKTSIVFATQDSPGALHGCLGEFATRGINLTKIESRPRRNKPWQYFFYVDFDGHFKDPTCEAALMALLRRAAILKMLGSYPAAVQPSDERTNN